MSAQTIFRVAHRNLPFSMLGNAMLRDKRLSFEARGMLAFVLSHPPDWRFSFEWLCREQAVGRDRAYRILGELIGSRYVTRSRARNANGTLGPWLYTFSDEPLPEKPDVAEPDLANPPPTNKVSPEETQNEEQEGGLRNQPIEGTDYGEAAAALVRQSADACAVGAPKPKPGAMPLDAPGRPVITADVRRAIEALDGDVAELVDRAMAQKARGKRIGNLGRYLVTMAKNDFIEQTGATPADVQAVLTGNIWAKQAAYGRVFEKGMQP